MPILNPAPCVPKFAGDNGGAIAAPAVTADTIRIGYYIAKSDPQQDAAAARSRARTTRRRTSSRRQGLRPDVREPVRALRAARSSS